MDQTMSNIGAGNLAAGIVTETTGTAMAIGVTADSVEGIHANHLPYQPHALPGKYLILPYAQTSAIIYKWFRDQFGQEELRQAGDPEQAYEALNALAAGVPAGCDGSGAAAVLRRGLHPGERHVRPRGVVRPDPEARQGPLRPGHPGGGGLHAAPHPEPDPGGGHPHPRRCARMGGAARSDLWLQIKADICGLPMVRMQEEETTGLGCALLAAVAVGDFADVGEAARAMVRLGRRFEPQPAQPGGLRPAVRAVPGAVPGPEAGVPQIL